MPNIAIINGKTQLEQEASIPVLDRGFLFGDSIYEVIRTRNGVPYQIQPHIDRLQASARQVHIQLPFSPDHIRQLIRRGLAESGHAEAYIRIIISRGFGPSDINPRLVEKESWVMLFRELKVPTADQYEKGISAAIPQICRNDPGALNPKIKSGNYLNNILALLQAQQKGAEEALILNREGNLTEATTANAFIVEDGKTCTPPLAEGILEGITRAFLLQKAQEDNLPIKEEFITLDRLRAAREVFITSTTKDILAITSLDGKPIHDGKPGPVTRDLMQRMVKWADKLHQTEQDNWGK